MKICEADHENCFRSYKVAQGSKSAICVGLNAKTVIEIPRVILCVDDGENSLSFELEGMESANMGEALIKVFLTQDLWTENPWKIIGDQVLEDLKPT